MVNDTTDSAASRQDVAFKAAVVQGLMDVEQGKTVGLDEVKSLLDLC